jgi:hypothetical protein
MFTGVVKIEIHCPASARVNTPIFRPITSSRQVAAGLSG